MKTLHPFAIASNDRLQASALANQLNPYDNALEAMMDFSHSARMVISADMPAPDASALMQREHSALHFVINARHQMLGIITQELLAPDNLLKLVDKAHQPSSWTVFDLMLPREQLQALAYDEVASASVADVLQSLRHSRDNYFAVVDTQTHQIRGLLSLADISHRLNVGQLREDKGGNLLNILRQINTSHGLVQQMA
ncbi:hypothetical protein BFS86_18315 [Shewanella algae]|nr:hypothetical protein BFS86_18315 [Shewanella algae]